MGLMFRQFKRSLTIPERKDFLVTMDSTLIHCPYGASSL